MENYLLEIASALVAVAGFLAMVTGFALKNWVKLTAIYTSAESAYYTVEEMALNEGWTTAKKIEAFEEKFKSLMSWGFWVLDKKTISTAHDIATGLCNKYRDAKANAKKKAKK